MKSKHRHMKLPEPTKEFAPPVFNPAEYYADALAGKESLSEAIAMRGFRSLLEELEPEDIGIESASDVAEKIGTIQLWGSSIWDNLRPMTRNLEKERGFASVEVGDRLEIQFSHNRMGVLEIRFVDAADDELALEPFFDYTHMFIANEARELYPNERLYCVITSCDCYKGPHDPEKPTKRRIIYAFDANLHRETIN